MRRCGARSRVGPLRTTATPAFAQTVRLRRLGDVWRRHPGLAVAITPGCAVADLARDGLDVGVPSVVGDWPGVMAELVVASRSLLLGTPALQARDPDIARLPSLLEPADPPEMRWAGGVRAHLAWLDGHAIASPMLAVSAWNASARLMFMSVPVGAENLVSGRVVEVPSPGMPRVTCCAVTPPGPRRPAVASFMAWLGEQEARASQEMFHVKHRPSGRSAPAWPGVG